MRKPLVIANWKMYGSQEFTKQWTKAFGLNNAITDVDVVICPPYPYLLGLNNLLSDMQIAVGAQNINENTNGAFTGEVSAKMLIDCDCRYVIIGHSERRELFGDTDIRIANKMQTALHCGIISILCVGESDAQHQSNETQTVLSQQIETALQEVSINDNLADSLVLAYEPIWAIGSGQSATPEAVEAVANFIRADVLSDIVGNDVANKVRILYGGSVNKDNAQDLFSLSNIDGGLIGGASLKGDIFRFLCEVAK